MVACEEPCREPAWKFCLHLTSQLPAVGAPLGPGPRVLAAELDPWGGGVSGASVALGASTRRALTRSSGVPGVPATACPGPSGAPGPPGKPSCLGRPVLYTLQLSPRVSSRSEMTSFSSARTRTGKRSLAHSLCPPPALKSPDSVNSERHFPTQKCKNWCMRRSALQRRRWALWTGRGAGGLLGLD